MEKAYKLLAVQEKISNKEAKKLIDDGYVFHTGRKIKIARADMPLNTVFKIHKPKDSKVLYEDKDLIAVEKPFGVNSYDLEKKYKAELIHRLDKTTSGIVLLSKNEEFKNKAVEEFKAQRVKKEYIAIVNGTFAETMTIEEPIMTTKGSGVARSRVDKFGKEATTIVTPLEVLEKKTKLKVEILTGRTHQIRVHLQHVGFPILGDTAYDGRDAKRIFLHAHKIAIFDKEITSPEPKEFTLSE